MAKNKNNGRNTNNGGGNKSHDVAEMAAASRKGQRDKRDRRQSEAAAARAQKAEAVAKAEKNYITAVSNNTIKLRAKEKDPARRRGLPHTEEEYASAYFRYKSGKMGQEDYELLCQLQNSGIIPEILNGKVVFDYSKIDKRNSIMLFRKDPVYAATIAALESAGEILKLDTNRIEGIFGSASYSNWSDSLNELFKMAPEYEPDLKRLVSAPTGQKAFYLTILKKKVQENTPKEENPEKAQIKKLKSELKSNPSGLFSF